MKLCRLFSIFERDSTLIVGHTDFIVTLEN